MTRSDIHRRPPTVAVGGRPVPAWSVSLALHFVLFAIVAYSLRFAPRGARTDQPDRTVGVALVREAAAGEREYLTTEEAQDVSQSARQTAAMMETLPADDQLQVDLSSVLPSNDAGAGSAESLLLPPSGQTSLTRGGQIGEGNKVRTTVFGLSGSGDRFVYVFDRSGSMAGFGGRPLAAAKRELSASLDDLSDTSQFQIIFYNEDPHVFRSGPGRPRLVFGTEDKRRAAKRFVKAINANGSTRHLQPLRMALGMKPDVVFFLTDADEPQLTSDQLNQIQRWNYGTAINSIEFGFGPQRRTDNFLMRLARQNGGEHVYVDVSDLRVAK